MLTVRDLRKKMVGMDPDAPVLVPSGDHQFYTPTVRKERVLAARGAFHTHFCGDDPGVRLRDNEFRVKALVIGG